MKSLTFGSFWRLEGMSALKKVEFYYVSGVSILDCLGHQYPDRRVPPVIGKIELSRASRSNGVSQSNLIRDRGAVQIECRNLGIPLSPQPWQKASIERT